MFEESGGKAKTAGFRIQFMKLAYSGILPGIAPFSISLTTTHKTSTDECQDWGYCLTRFILTARFRR